MELTEKEVTIAREIATIMQSRGVEKVEVEYSGSGDSQDEFEVTEFKNGESSIIHGYDDALAEKLDDLVSEKFGGYENNDGGYGEISLLLAEASLHIQWDHSDNIINDQNDDDAVLTNEVIETFVKAIKEVDAYSCTVTYVGGGDSMDGYDFTFHDANGKEITINDQDNLTMELSMKLDDLMCNGPVAGFWNNEGGGGEIGINRDALENDDAYWNHYYNYEDTETTSIDMVIPLTEKESSDA